MARWRRKLRKRLGLAPPPPERPDWKPSRWLWNRGFGLASDVVAPGVLLGRGDPVDFDPRAYRRIRRGDVVCVAMSTLGDFCRQVLPGVAHPFVLVTIRGSWSVPGRLARETGFDPGALLADPRLLHWFTVNHDGTRHPKLSPIPIGLDFHTRAVSREGNYGEPNSDPAEQERELAALLGELEPTRERIPRVHVDFHFRDTQAENRSDSGERRADLAALLRDAPFVDFQRERLPRTRYWRERGRYAFTLSPHGKGLDCHRTWESLVLGCIVIVKTSSLDPLYEGLPVAVVERWSDVDARRLAGWLEEHGGAFGDPAVRRRLELDSWLERIRQRSDPAAAGGYL